MSRKRPLVLVILTAVMALIVGVYDARLGTAQAGEPPAAAALMSDGAVNMSMPADDTSSQIDPAREVMPCGCAPTGSSCAGACPVAPGPQRHCKNIAPAGKPKICSCV